MISLEQVKDALVVISAGISVVGIPTLIALIWRFHETQVRALQLFTFKEVEQQIAAMENTYTRVNKRLREYVVELENWQSNKYEEPIGEIDNRLKILTKAQEELMKLPFTMDERREKEHKYLSRLYGMHNERAFLLARGVLEQLIAYEEELKTKTYGVNPFKKKQS